MKKNIILVLLFVFCIINNNFSMESEDIYANNRVSGIDTPVTNKKRLVKEKEKEVEDIHITYRTQLEEYKIMHTKRNKQYSYLNGLYKQYKQFFCSNVHFHNITNKQIKQIVLVMQISIYFGCNYLLNKLNKSCDLLPIEDSLLQLVIQNIYNSYE